MAYAGGRQGVSTLVVAPAWVGDMVMAHAVVPGLATRGAVHFLAPNATAALATRMEGVASVQRIGTTHGTLGLRERLRVGYRLRELRCDQAIVLPSSFKSALTPLFAGIPRRTGWRGEFRYGVLNDVRQLDRVRWPRLVDRFAALADVAPTTPRLSADPAARQRLLAKHRLRTEGPIVALCPGAAYGPAKRWPVEHFAALARRCTNAGAEVWIVGSAKETSIGEAICASQGADGSTVVNLAGRTSLLEVVDLLSAASVVVSNDSGLLHVAAALDVPVVAVYGSTSPDFTPPLGTRAATVQRELGCRPCFQRECPLGHTDCLQGLAPAEVFDAVHGLGCLETPGRAVAP